MKFKLFGRLRGDDDSGNDSGSNASPEPGLSGNDDMDMGGGMNPSMGSGLEQTVENMFNQGYSEEEIRQELQGQYSEQEIQDAVSQVVKSQASGQSGGPEPMTPYNGGDENVSPMDEGFNQQGNQMNQDSMEQGPPQPEPQGSSPQGQQPIQDPGMDSGEQNNISGGQPQVEELVETIVAENFEKVEKEFENAYSEIDSLKEKIDDLENRVHDLEVRDDEDQDQFIQKMDEIEKDIDSYQSRIGGLEKAFQQVLPSLVDNVRELTGLVQEIKQEKGIETETSVSEDDIEDLEDW